MHSGRILHYEILERLGAGAMGEVFLAEDTRLGRRVVLKFLTRAGAPGAADDRLAREARALAALSHPHIARVFALETSAGTAFLVMEHVDGETLAEVLAMGALPAPEVAHIGASIAGALAHAHAHGVVHRDVKPENILVTEDGHVRLTDFGIATPRGGEGDDADGLVWGTPEYMSPEQARGAPPDGRGDQYALGVVLIEALTGQAPRPDRSPLGTLADWRARASEPVSPGLDGLVRVLTRCVQPLPGQRYPDASALHADLARLVALLEGRAGARPRHLKRLLLAAALLGMLAVAALWTALGRPPWRPDAGAVGMRTVRVDPVSVAGGQSSDAYVGQAFGEALRVGLARAENLQVLPAGHGAARPPDADLRVAGQVQRQSGTNRVELQLVDGRTGRLLWTVRREAVDRELRFLPRAMADDIVRHVHAPPTALYDYYLYSLQSPALGTSPVASAALGALRRGDMEAARKWTAELVRRFPREPEAHVLRSLHLLQEGWNVGPSDEQRRAFLAELERLRAIDPRSPWPDYFEGLLLHRLGHPADAERLFDRVLEREDLTAAARSLVISRRGQARRDLDQPEAAHADLDEAVRLDPTNDLTLTICADVLGVAGHPEEGLVRARQAYALNPESPQNIITMAQCLGRLGRWDEAVPYIEMACHQQPDAATLALSALILRHAGRRAEAEAQLALAADEPPSDWAYFAMARYQMLAGHPARALHELHLAVQRGYSDPEILRIPEFDPLRRTPEFIGLVDTMRKHWRSADGALAGRP